MGGIVERILGMIAGLTAVACLLCSCQTANAELPDSFDEELVQKEALRSIEYFNERDYQGIIDMGCQDLKESITAGQFAEQCDPVLDKRGEFREIMKIVFYGETEEESGEEYGFAVIVGDYEEGRIQFYIGFDKEMELTQFVIR